MIKVTKNACLLDAMFVCVDLMMIHFAHYVLLRLVMAKVLVVHDEHML